MKWCALLVLLVLGVTKAQDTGDKSGIHLRMARRAMVGMGEVFLAQMEVTLVRNCQKNGLSTEEALKLKGTYDQVTSCLAEVNIFLLTKSEFIDKIVSCSRDAISKTKACLKPDQKYFPDFILDLAKSFVNFIYDDITLFGSRDVAMCLTNFERYEVQKGYMNCLTIVAIETHDDENIPESKDEFCGKLLPAVKCFPNTLNKYCEQTSDVKTFLSHYTRTMEVVCEEKE